MRLALCQTTEKESVIVKGKPHHKLTPKLSAVDLARETNKTGGNIRVSSVKRRLSEIGGKAYRTDQQKTPSNRSNT